MMIRIPQGAQEGRLIRLPNNEVNVLTRGGTHDGYVFFATHDQYFFHCD